MRRFVFISFSLLFIVALCLVGCKDTQSKGYYERYSKDFNSLDDSQKSFIKNAYDSLDKDDGEDFVYPILAIAWQESSFGKNVYNHKDPSCGAFQQLLADHYLKHLKIKDKSLLKKSELCLRLIVDRDFALSQVRDRLKEWKNRYKDKWWGQLGYILRSYNGGQNHNQDTAVYERRIKARIKVLEDKLDDIL